jgi:hypothetical protein
VEGAILISAAIHADFQRSSSNLFLKGKKHMKKRATAFVFAALTGAVCANAQVVPVGGTGQALIARFYAGIDCKTAQPTGFGTAALFTPIMAGIPAQYLFQPGATVQDVTTATITGVFSKVQLSQSQNFNIVNTFLPSNAVKYYYHPNSSPKDWTDFDGFQAGQLIGVYQVQPEMFSTLNGVSWGVVSGPFTYTSDFILPDGSKANLANFMPGGITAHTIAALGTFVSATPGGAPQVLDLSTGKGPMVLGSCAVMIPFSGSGTNPGSQESTRQIRGLERTSAAE